MGVPWWPFPPVSPANSAVHIYCHILMMLQPKSVLHLQSCRMLYPCLRHYHPSFLASDAYASSVQGWDFIQIKLGLYFTCWPHSTLSDSGKIQNVWSFCQNAKWKWILEVSHIQASPFSQFLVLSALGSFWKGHEVQKLKSVGPFQFQLSSTQQWKSQNNLNRSQNNLWTWEEMAENFIRVFVYFGDGIVIWRMAKVIQNRRCWLIEKSCINNACSMCLGGDSALRVHQGAVVNWVDQEPPKNK